MRALYLASATSFLLAGCSSVPGPVTETIAQTTLLSANGETVGAGQLLTDGSTLSLAVTVNGLEPGEHGFHLHTTGRCKAPDFKSAGGHLNPDNNEHGTLNPQGAHLGDLPNLVAGATRSASVEVDIGRDTPIRRSQMFDADGTALVIHAGPDDYRTDPAGNAGARVACGVMQQN